LLGGSQVNNNTMVNANMNLVARWNRITVTVIFDSNGGNVNPSNISVISGMAVGTLPIRTRANYNFAGWWTWLTGGTQITANTIVTTNTTFFARWNPFPVSISFNSNGGTPNPASRVIANGSQIGALPTVIRDNHSFEGWWTALIGGTRITSSSVITANITLFARWNLVSVTVTFSPTGGSVSPTNIILNSGNAVGTLPTPIRTNHNFAGWWTLATGGSQVNSNTIVNNNITFFARWNPIPVTVTFNPNWGDLNTTTITLNSGNVIGTLPTLSRANRTFAGWWTDRTRGIQVNENTIVNNNITLFARWNANQRIRTINNNHYRRNGYFDGKPIYCI